MLFIALLTHCASKNIANAQEDDQSPAPVPLNESAGSFSRCTLTYREIEGVKLQAEFQRPTGDAIVPVVLFVHGGAWVTGSRMHFMMHAEQVLASGLAVFSIDYRLAPKYKFPAPLDDVREALKYVATNADQLKIDPQRIVLWGYSAGGQLATLAAFEDVSGVPRPFLCVSGGTPADLTELPENNNALSAIFGGTRKQVPDTYRSASPVTFVSSDDPPTFVYQGDSDLLVSKKYGDRLYDKLISEKVHAEYFVCAGQGHIAAFLSNKPVTQALSFIRRTLDESSADETSE
jgi:acetyl esterase/lipase